MPTFAARGGTIHFEHHGARANPRVLFVHGLGCQLVQWPRSLIEGVAAAGLCAVLMDNRDAGLSHGVDAPAPSIEQLLAAHAAPSTLAPPYTLSAMAQDVLDLLDHLGQGGAHVVGVSMGGMIAQHLAMAHPNRVFSLVSIMSSTGNPDLPGPTPEAIAALVAAMGSDSAEAAITNGVRAANVLGGAHFPSERFGIARFARLAVERAYRPKGVARQLAAILTDGDRRAGLARLDVPTLVIHGADDPLVPAEAGRDTAATVPSAEYMELEKLGHDLSEPVVERIVAAINRHVLGAGARR